MSDVIKKKKKRKKKVLFPLLVKFELQWILSFSFSWFMKQHGIDDIKATDNTRRYDGDKELIIFMNYIVN